MGVDPESKTGKVWRAVLRGISDDQIDSGLAAFADTESVFIPTATEFKALCKYGGDTRQQAAFKQQAMLAKGLPILPASKDFSKDAIKKARQAMKGNSDERIKD